MYLIWVISITIPDPVWHSKPLFSIAEMAEYTHLRGLFVLGLIKKKKKKRREVQVWCLTADQSPFTNQQCFKPWTDQTSIDPPLSSYLHHKVKKN